MPKLSSLPTLTGVLRSTLEQIERSGDIDPTDPAFVELKRSITRAMAEFEVAKSSNTHSELEPPLLESA
jgi:hypothetical protein